MRLCVCVRVCVCVCVFVLTANVPHVELEAVVHERLDVEALRRHDVADVLLAQLLEDRRLAGVVQA